MRLWNPQTRFLPLALLLGTQVEADSLGHCLISVNPDETCTQPLEDITIVTPGEFIVAKVQCFGCPTTARSEEGHHIITHEENALFFNISLSTSGTELLLNNIRVFPSLDFPPRTIYAAQIPLNFSLSSLSSTIECTHEPCQNLDSKCDCVAVSLGGMGLSYDYALLPSPNTTESRDIWRVQFDAIGGHNGYMVDPYVEFDAPQQRVLSISIQKHGNDGRLKIVEAKLINREPKPQPAPPSSAWEKMWQFFGFETEERQMSGHTVYDQNMWDSYGRIGTLKHLLLEKWGEWPWGLIAIICGSILGGLTLMYAIYRIVVLVHKSPAGHDRRGADDEEDKGSEEERLLTDEEEEEYSP